MTRAKIQKGIPESSTKVYKDLVRLFIFKEASGYKNCKASHRG